MGERNERKKIEGSIPLVTQVVSDRKAMVEEVTPSKIIGGKLFATNYRLTISRVRFSS